MFYTYSEPVPELLRLDLNWVELLVMLRWGEDSFISK